MGGEWRFVEGVSDVARTRRQQQLMVALLARLNEIRSPAGLAATAEQLGETLALDDSVSLRVGETRSAWKTQAAVEELFRDGAAPYASS